MNYNKLAADPTSLVLGIVSLVIILLGCCCGIFAVIALVMSIIGLVLAVKSLKEFDQYPDNFSIQSKKNVYAGKIVCLIGLVLSALFIVIYAVVFVLYQVNFADKVKEIYQEGRERQYQTQDTIYNQSIEDTISQSDSVYIDSVKIE
ncbi:CCC motif membrane protein [Flavobacterium sp.]|jgi:hypothetical protein|uniref:CCC motif membrane protein n=1 Tax=Flavobacterium sp. TaxID=239 RepID=UPI0037C00A08